MKTFFLALATLLLAIGTQAQTGYFITQWNTSLDTTNDGMIIPFYGEGTNYSVMVTGLDTVFSSTLTVSGHVNIVVPKRGSYTVLAASGSGTFNGYSNYGGGTGTPQTDSRDMLTGITQWGTAKFTRLNFNSADNLDITANDVPDLSQMTDMQEAFAHCPSLKGNKHIGEWNVSNVTIFYKMFQGDVKFSQDLSKWNLKSAINVGQIFSYSGMSKCNYTAALNGWAANPNTAYEVFFGGQDEMKFTDSTGRNILTGQRRWRIDEDTYTSGGCSAAEAGVRFNTTSASTNNGQLSVSWVTAAENNSDHFDVEVSSDSVSFKKLVTVNSKAVDGNSSQPLQYSVNAPLTEVTSVLSVFVLLGIGFSKKRRVVCGMMMLAITLLTIASCKKSSTVPPVDHGSKKIYVRIAQVDKAGVKTYSDVMTAEK